jgi:hypothetical protein
MARGPLGLPTFRVPWSECAHCGSKADGASAATGTEGPKAGDAMLCIVCGHWSIYAAGCGVGRVYAAWAATLGRHRLL